MARGAMARMAASWLGAGSVGRPMVAYRGEIFRLLLFKEMKLGPASTASVTEDEEETGSVPEGINALSIVRGLVIVFISKLPTDVPDEVRLELLHWRHPEMKRLRKKQTKFFRNYDVDTACTPEGLLSIPVDEGDEVCSIHLVEVMKRCPEEVNVEAHEGRGHALETGGDFRRRDVARRGRRQRPRRPHQLPAQDLLHRCPRPGSGPAWGRAGTQRRGRTAGGPRGVHQPHQQGPAILVGLARTVMILAADCLVVPDLGVKKLEKFKSISVGAGDWVDIKEVREKNLLGWLQKKTGGSTMF